MNDPSLAPTEAARRSGILDLVVRLQERKVSISAAELLDATHLLLRLQEAKRAPTDPEALRPLLRPVLCKRVEEQAAFDVAFNEWLKERELPPAPQTEVTSAAGRDVKPAPQPANRFPVDRIATVAVPSFALALLFFVVVRGHGVSGAINVPAKPVATVVSPTPSATGSGGPVVDPPPPPVSEALGYVPVTRVNRELKPAWVLLGFALALLPLAFLRLPALVLARGRRRTGRKVELDASRVEAEALKLVPPLGSETSSRLSRHLRGRASDPRRLSRRPAVDVQRTIIATAQKLGVPSLRYRHAQLRPSYLMLIDGDVQSDARGRLFYEWGKRLMREGWDVEIRIFQRDPLRPVDEAPRTSRIENAGWSESRTVVAPLDHLEDPPVGQRLLVLSDGDAFFDAESGQLRPWVGRARLKRWRERVMFTPKQVRYWGAGEVALEQPESNADPGFLVLPLDEPALDAWGLSLATGRLGQFTLSEPERYPPLLAKDEARALSEGEFQGVERLIAELRLYLGPTGFRWLAALAVPPLARWDLTLLIGSSLLEAQSASGKRAASDEAERRALTLGVNYRRLARLPWFRQAAQGAGSGHMPSWLRLRLLQELTPEATEQVREAVRHALSWVNPGAHGVGQPLDIELPPSGEAEKSAGRADEKSQGDVLYLGYMEGVSGEQLGLRVPDWKWLEAQRAQHGSGRGGWTRHWFARLRALWARLAFRDGVAARGLAAWSGLFAAGALSLWILLVVLLLSAPSKGLLAPLFTLKSRGVGLTNIPLVDLRFSDDGERLFTVDQDGTARTIEMKTGKERAVMRGPNYAVDAATFSRDGRRLLTAAPGVVEVWDVEAGTRLVSVRDAKNGVLSDEGSLLVTSAQSHFDVWHVPADQPASTTSLALPVSALALSRTGTRVAMALGDSLWIYSTGPEPSLLATFDLPRTPCVAPKLVFAPDGQRLTAECQGAWRVLDLEKRQIQTASVTSEDPGSSGYQPRASHSAVSADGTHVAAATGGIVSVENIPKGSGAMGEYPAEDAVQGLDLSEDGSTLALIFSDHVRIANQKLAFKWAEHVRFSSDGGYLAITGGDEPVAQLWARGQPRAGQSDLPPVQRDLAQDGLLAGGGLFLDSWHWLGVVAGLVALAWVADLAWLRSAFKVPAPPSPPPPTPARERHG